MTTVNVTMTTGQLSNRVCCLYKVKRSVGAPANRTINVSSSRVDVIRQNCVNNSELLAVALYSPPSTVYLCKTVVCLGDENFV
jgi:hypothetical protein